MTKKQPAQNEPFLNTVARRLGKAAGTLTKATHNLATNLSCLPESVAAKASAVTATSNSPARLPVAAINSGKRKKTQPAARTRMTKDVRNAKSHGRRTQKKSARNTPTRKG